MGSFRRVYTCSSKWFLATHQKLMNDFEHLIYLIDLAVLASLQHWHPIHEDMLGLKTLPKSPVPHHAALHIASPKLSGSSSFRTSPPWKDAAGTWELYIHVVNGIFVENVKNLLMNCSFSNPWDYDSVSTIHRIIISQIMRNPCVFAL